MALATPWQPGQSGNPLGASVRTFRLATYARKVTKDGRKLVDFMLAVMEGKPLPLVSTRDGRRSRYPQTPKVEHRLIAAQWLADRGWGKAKELIELTGESVTTPEQRLALLRRLSDEDRVQLRQLLAKALASDGSESAPLEVHDPAHELEPAAAAGAPELLGAPRNVGRAVVPELVEPADPADPPADSPPNSPPASLNPALP